MTDKKKLGQESAFPVNVLSDNKNTHGMSKRFYAACAAMQGILANDTVIMQLIKVAKEQGHNKEEIFVVKEAYAYADELLKQEQQ